MLTTITAEQRDARLNLARTKVALEAHDRARAAFVAALGSAPNETVDALLGALLRAEKAVGEAFAEDTQDRNQYETARRQLPCPWLRGLVEKYG